MTPVVVIGGWLGAGKTTLVNHLLHHAEGRRLAVLVNDFGSVSIDADLIEGAADGVLALAGGCVCCSFGADLVGTLERALQRTPPPDAVLVECSGVGMPAAVARTAALARGAHIEGVLVVADASALHRLAADTYVGDTVREQLAQADLLLLNQADRASAASLRDTFTLLARLAPGVPAAACRHGDVPPALVLGLGAARGPTAAAGGRAMRLGQGGWAAAAAAHGPAAQRFTFTEHLVEQPVADPHALAAQLAAPAAGLLRAKGVVRDAAGRRWLLQVMGRRTSVEPAPGGAAPRPGDGRLVVIARAGPGVNGAAGATPAAH